MIYQQSNRIDGKRVLTKLGRYWKGIVDRCNPENSKSRPAYKNCINNFESFDHFAKWAENQIGFESYFDLDKDIIGQDSYSEDTCVFVPEEINNFLTSRKNSRGSYPQGVRKTENGTFQARCSSSGVRISIGTFGTYEEAFHAYKIVKESEAKILAKKWKSQIDPRAYNALMSYQVEITD